MKERNTTPRLRAIDRTIIIILAILHVANGLYLCGPWYLSTWRDGESAPLYLLFNNTAAVSAYGMLLLINGIILGYGAIANHTAPYRMKALVYGLAIGFSLRLYSLIGAIYTLESWKSPTYLSHAATVAICGALWVSIKLSGGPSK